MENKLPNMNIHTDPWGKRSVWRNGVLISEENLNKKTMASIFKAKDQFIQASFYDGSDESFEKLQEFLSIYPVEVKKNDAGYLLIKEQGEVMTLDKDIYFFKEPTGFMYLPKSTFEFLFFKPDMSHN